MLQQFEGPVGNEPEPMLSKTRPEQGLSPFRCVNTLHLDDPNIERLPYAPTPSGAWQLEVRRRTYSEVGVIPSIAKVALGEYGGDESESAVLSFIVYGNQEISTRIDESLADMPAACRPNEELVEFFKIANLGAFANRIDKNSSLDIETSGLSIDDYNILSLGIGKPSELAGIFDNHYDSLISSELAKQTVGMRWNQTTEMDEAVGMATEDHGYERLSTEARYYYTGGLFDVGEFHTNERAGIYVRKKELASKNVEGGQLVLIQRDSFMVDFRHKNTKDLLPSFCKWYNESLIKESSGGDDYKYFQNVSNEDDIVKRIRENHQKSSSDRVVRGGSGLKVPVYGGQVTDMLDNFGKKVAERIESAASSTSITGEQYSSELGIYPANRSYYVYYKKS